MRRMIAVIGAAVMLAGCGALQHAAAVSGPSAPKYYVGVHEESFPSWWNAISGFGKATSVTPQLVMWYVAWGGSFPWHPLTLVAKHGDTPVIQFDPKPLLSKIAKGRDDAYIRHFADEARAYGHKLVIGFGHEMNGGWYPWGYGHQSAKSFVAAWRHIVTVFRHAKAKNVVWMWTPSHLYPSRYRAYWPGDKYVTWVGIDGYLAGGGASFNRTFADALKDVRRLTNKPVLLAETAVSPKTRNQAADIVSLFAGVKKHHLLGLVYFDVGEHSWRLEGHPKLLRAFRRGAALLGIS